MSDIKILSFGKKKLLRENDYAAGFKVTMSPARLCYVVVDQADRYIGIISWKEAKGSSGGDAQPISAGEMCNRNATIIRANDLSDPGIVKEAKKLFNAKPYLYYLPIVSVEERPLGLVYKDKPAVAAGYAANGGKPLLAHFLPAAAGGAHEGTWDVNWGGPEAHWHGRLMPRLSSWLPTGTILEIGVGYGRWIPFLSAQAKQYIGVDVMKACSDYCEAEWSYLNNTKFYTNDGTSLPMIEDSSVDLLFSFQSLSYTNIEQYGDCLREFMRVLRPQGVGFIEIKNGDPYAEDLLYEGSLPAVTPENMRNAISDAGGMPLVQETLQYELPGSPMRRFTTLFSKDSSERKDCVLLTNEFFGMEAFIVQNYINPYCTFGKKGTAKRV